MVHNSFKINGKQFTKDTISSLIEELESSNEEYYKDIGTFLLEWFNSSNYVDVNTSGSTGTPKKIQLNKDFMRNSAIATGSFFNVKEYSKALLCLSANYIAGKMMLVRTIVLGWDLYLVAPSSNPLESIDGTFDFAAMVPIQVEGSLKQLHRIKQLIIGGAPVSSSLAKELLKVNTKCYATYGMTETITHIAVKKLNYLNSKEDHYYRLLPNVTIEKDSRDCLVIKAPLVSKDKVITNDLVNILDTNSFEWLGRFDNVINSGGVKLFPEQIEECLSNIINERFFVAGIPDEKLGKRLVLLIESKSKITLTKEDYLKVGLTPFEHPKAIFTLPVFKETPTGKIQRKKTLELL